MTDIFDIPGWIILSSRLDTGIRTIEAEYAPPLQACTKCGVLGRLYRHGTKVVRYRDSPIQDVHVQLAATVQRYRCRECGGTSLQALAGVDTARRMTQRCIRYIKAHCLRDSFSRLSEKIGCDEKTIRNIAGHYVTELAGSFQVYLPNWLGIDEVYIAGAWRCVLIDIGRNIPIDVLPDRGEHTLADWLHRFDDRSTTHGVVTNMQAPYSQMANALLPAAPVVIDKSHVFQMLNYSVDKAPTRLGEEALRFRQEFYALYDRSKMEVIPALEAWEEAVTSSPLQRYFRELLSALKVWHEQILAYFDHPITHGYTEVLNSMAKELNRAGRGYSFDVQRARLLFSRSAHTSSPTGNSDLALGCSKPTN